MIMPVATLVVRRHSLVTLSSTWSQEQAHLDAQRIENMPQSECYTRLKHLHVHNNVCAQQGETTTADVGAHGQSIS
jgi:hypothetical protein